MSQSSTFALQTNPFKRATAERRIEHARARVRSTAKRVSHTSYLDLEDPTPLKWNYIRIGFCAETVFKNLCVRPRGYLLKNWLPSSSLTKQGFCKSTGSCRFPRTDDAPELPPTAVILTKKEDPDMEKARRLVSTMYDARQIRVIYCLVRLKLQDPFHSEAPEDLLPRLERVEFRLKTSTAINKPTRGAVSTLRVDFNKLLEHRSSLTSHPNNIPDDTPPTIKLVNLLQRVPQLKNH